MPTKTRAISGLFALIAIILLVYSIFTANLSMEPTGSEDVMPAPDLEIDPVDALLEEMELAAMAFNAPSSMNIDDTQQIQLILSAVDSVEQIKKSITAEGEKLGFTIKISDRMEARLSGRMFDITQITSATQAVSKRQPTEWKWEISPRKQGRHSLHLTLTALLEIDGHSTPRTIKTFEKSIEVEITASQQARRFVENNWQWLWAAILAPFAGWLWRRKKKQSNRA